MGGIRKIPTETMSCVASEEVFGRILEAVFVVLLVTILVCPLRGKPNFFCDQFVANSAQFAPMSTNERQD
jgi:hypothetical protein